MPATVLFLYQDGRYLVFVEVDFSLPAQGVNGLRMCLPWLLAW
jgi:hypothetical protein